MTVQKKTLKAHLIKYRDPHLQDYIWFWINPNTGNKISGDFFSQEEAEDWFREMVSIYDEATTLIKRAKDGRFFFLEGILEYTNVEKNPNCPFYHKIEVSETGEKILTVKVLGKNLMDAKQRIEIFYDVRQWKEINEYDE